MPHYLNPATRDVFASVDELEAIERGLVPIDRASFQSIRGVPKKYRKWDGTVVSEMSPAEKLVVDQADDQVEKATIKRRLDDERLLMAMIAWVTRQLNELRIAAGLTPLTPADVKQGIKEEVDRG